MISNPNRQIVTFGTWFGKHTNLSEAMSFPVNGVFPFES